ncbi:MAG TPA: arylamine N-acetyltransferase [Dongiaceae bacterium]|jgi:N-hydroxyarylamine O-acetyltransferase|nr:arylamine N-acetyltransferase [Dongiaceae bacterium]
MDEAAIDLDAYFRRIGYAGPREPTLDVLAALQKHHLGAIPFENLDVLLRRPIRLDPESLQRKLVDDRRGGYCFESNGLLFHVLRAMGFRTTALAARVLFERPEFPLPPRSHMLQRVEVEGGAYLVDVAFGGLTPAGLLRFEPHAAQATARESCRLVPAGDELDLQARMGAEWRTLYRIATHPHLPVDYEQANWHVSTHPESYFVNNLIVAMPGEGCRYTLFNDVFRTRHPDGRVEEQAVVSGAALVALIEGTFAIPLTEDQRARLAQRIPA